MALTIGASATAYLTFVAKPDLPPPPTLFKSLTHAVGLTTPPRPTRRQVPAVEPSSTLESKRFLLAGRRRAHRIQGSHKNDELLARFRKQLFAIEAEQRELLPSQQGVEEDNIAALQQEMIVEAYMRQDPDVRAEDGFVVASIEGFMEPVKIPLATVQKAAAQRGHGGYRRLSMPSAESVDQATGHSTKGAASNEVRGVLTMGDTLVNGM